MVRNGGGGDEFYFAEGCFITELHNTGDDPAVPVARARVEAGRTTRWHCLEGIVERYLLVAGCGRVEIGTEAPRTGTWKQNHEIYQG